MSVAVMTGGPLAGNEASSLPTSTPSTRRSGSCCSVADREKEASAQSSHDRRCGCRRLCPSSSAPQTELHFPSGDERADHLAQLGQDNFAICVLLEIDEATRLERRLSIWLDDHILQSQLADLRTVVGQRQLETRQLDRHVARIDQRDAGADLKCAVVRACCALQCGLQQTAACCRWASLAQYAEVRYAKVREASEAGELDRLVQRRQELHATGGDDDVLGLQLERRGVLLEQGCRDGAESLCRTRAGGRSETDICAHSFEHAGLDCNAAGDKEASHLLAVAEEVCWLVEADGGCERAEVDKTQACARHDAVLIHAVHHNGDELHLSPLGQRTDEGCTHRRKQCSRAGRAERNRKPPLSEAQSTRDAVVA
jgi:hypothetical protein